MVSIRVLAIAGSPRRHGNSETLLDWVIERMMKDPGVNITKVALTEVDIAPCRGCNACEKLNQCVIRDGMDLMHDQIIEADCIILAAPVYCMSICSQAKGLVDRVQVFRSRKYVLNLPVVSPERKGKRLGLFISTAGQDWSYVFDSSVTVIKCFFHVIEVREKDIRYLMVRDVDEKGAILQHRGARDEAKKIADEMISTLKERLLA
jgi:multimeric flavodoxin WrbA